MPWMHSAVGTMKKGAEENTPRKLKFYVPTERLFWINKIILTSIQLLSEIPNQFVSYSREKYKKDKTIPRRHTFIHIENKWGLSQWKDLNTLTREPIFHLEKGSNSISRKLPSQYDKWKIVSLPPPGIEVQPTLLRNGTRLNGVYKNTALHKQRIRDLKQVLAYIKWNN